MSHYTAEVGILKIKEEYQEEFGYFINKQYEKLTSPIFLEFLNEHPDGPIRTFVWDHEDSKPSWVGRYKTSYENGIFTYGVYFNESCGGWLYWSGFSDILYKIKEETLFQDFWDEPV